MELIWLLIGLGVGALVVGYLLGLLIKGTPPTKAVPEDTEQ